jgi:hypothetical protein
MSELSGSVEVSLGRQGRLMARQEADRLVLQKLDRVKKRLKARFAQVRVERALVDELIAERREPFCIEDSRRESV